MRHMVMIPQQKLERVCARFQFERDLSLTAPEVHMILVSRNTVFRDFGIVGPLAKRHTVQQHVVVTRSILFHTGGGHAHTAEAKDHCDRAADRGRRFQD